MLSFGPTCRVQSGYPAWQYFVKSFVLADNVAPSSWRARMIMRFAYPDDSWEAPSRGNERVSAPDRGQRTLAGWFAIHIPGNVYALYIEVPKLASRTPCAFSLTAGWVALLSWRPLTFSPDDRDKPLATRRIHRFWRRRQSTWPSALPRPARSLDSHQLSAWPYSRPSKLRPATRPSPTTRRGRTAPSVLYYRPAIIGSADLWPRDSGRSAGPLCWCREGESGRYRISALPARRNRYRPCSSTSTKGPRPGDARSWRRIGASSPVALVRLPASPLVRPASRCTFYQAWVGFGIKYSSDLHSELGSCAGASNGIDQRTSWANRLLIS